MITVEDIARLDKELEVAFADSDVWMKENEIDFEALQMIAWSASESVQEKMAAGGDFMQVFGETVCNSFVLGWEAFRQYGERKA